MTRAKTAGLRVGETVPVLLNDGTRVEGQVWSMAAEDGYCWLALGNGRFGKVSTRRTGAVTAERGRVMGQVAA